MKTVPLLVLSLISLAAAVGAAPRSPRSPASEGVRRREAAAGGQIPQNTDGHGETHSHFNDHSFWQTVNEAGYVTIAWHSYPPDAGSPTAEVYPASFIKSQIESTSEAIPGTIYLPHNGRLHTVQTLSTALADLKSKGLTLDLLHKGQSSSSEL